jgi:hypothetical protein
MILGFEVLFLLEPIEKSGYLNLMIDHQEVFLLNRRKLEIGFEINLQEIWAPILKHLLKPQEIGIAVVFNHFYIKIGYLRCKMIPIKAFKPSCSRLNG